MKSQFSEEEPVVEEGDCTIHAKHQESHSEVEDNQDDFVYEEANDHVNLAKVVDPDLFVDDNKLVNVVV